MVASCYYLVADPLEADEAFVVDRFAVGVHLVMLLDELFLEEGGK